MRLKLKCVVYWDLGVTVRENKKKIKQLLSLYNDKFCPCYLCFHAIFHLSSSSVHAIFVFKFQVEERAIVRKWQRICVSHLHTYKSQIEISIVNA